MGSAPLSVPRSRLEQRIVLIVRGRHNLPLAGPRPMTNPVQAENGGGSVWQAACISGLGSHWKMVMGKWFALVKTVPSSLRFSTAFSLASRACLLFPEFPACWDTSRVRHRLVHFHPSFLCVHPPLVANRSPH